ncbi:histidine kinase [Vibrio fortis]|uniref:sensor histidine kinase n=1 Tax=Vibrio fortis TaxID=212667 RepID=UPI002F407432
MKRVSIRRDIYLYLFGLLLLLTGAYALMVSQSYHIGINESAKYGFLYELKAAEQHFLTTGEAPHSDNPTFQVFLEPSQIPLKFQQAFVWRDFQADEIYEAYLPSNSEQGYGKYLYAAKHPVPGSSEILYIVSEYDEALYLTLFELSPPESVTQFNSAFLVIGALLLLVFLVVRLLVYRLTKPMSIETEVLLDKIVDGQRYLLSQKQVEVETNVSCGKIYQPRELVEVVLTNLVRNAFQHGGQGNVAMLLAEEGFEISNTTPEPGLSGKGSRDTSFGIGLELVERVCHSQGWQLSHQQHQDKFTVCVQFTDSKE